MRIGDGWPNEQQQRLIQACIWEGEAADHAWQHWKLETARQQLDPESIRLLPLLYYNLTSVGVVDAELAQYRQNLSSNWLRNQFMLREMEDVIQLLHANGIPTLILKGAALALTAYEQIGLRVMNDFDVLVPQASALSAIELISHEWAPLSYVPTSQTMRYKHSLGFVQRGAGKSYEFDMHWHLVEENIDGKLDERMWDRSGEIHLARGTATRVLCPADQLLHVCVHGLRADQELQRFRWVVDATQILRHQRVDWEWLQRQATDRQLLVPMRVALRYLQDVMHAPIPDAVLTYLEDARVDRRLVREYRTKSLRQTHLRRMKVHWFHFRRVNPEALPLTAGPAYFAYLRSRWGVNSFRDLIEFVRKSL